MCRSRLKPAASLRKCRRVPADAICGRMCVYILVYIGQLLFRLPASGACGSGFVFQNCGWAAEKLLRGGFWGALRCVRAVM